MSPTSSSSIYPVVHGVTIKVTLIKQSSLVDACIDELYSVLAKTNIKALGLAVEWDHNSSCKIAILKLCIDKRCFIFHLVHMDYIPVSLKSFLMDHHFTFVGVGIEDDMEKLGRDYGFSSNNNVLQLGPLASRVLMMNDLKDAGLVDIAKVVLGIHVDDKTLACGKRDWISRVVIEEIADAVGDAYLFYKLAEKLISWY